MIINCPKCGRRIEGSSLNAAKDLATCSACGEAFVLSELLAGPGRAPGDNLVAPPGTWFRMTPTGWQVGATTRSWMGLFIVPFLLFWTGGMFFGFAKSFDHAKSSGMFVALPFLFIVPVAAIFWAMALMTIAGTASVTKDSDSAIVFVGLGSIGWRKTVPWASINAIREEPSNFQTFGSRGARLCLDGQRRVAFGSMLNSERRFYMMRILQQQLVK